MNRMKTYKVERITVDWLDQFGRTKFLFYPKAHQQQQKGHIKQEEREKEKNK